MDHDTNRDVRRMVEREFGASRSTAPGMLAMSGGAGGAGGLKEVIAIIRPQRWAATKARAQRLHLPAFTEHRVLGRGSEGGLHRQQGVNQIAVGYLPKRMISWIVEAPMVGALVGAIMAENCTGQPGDGKIFVLPLDEALRVRTGEHGTDAIRPENAHETVEGNTEQPGGEA